jgi:hypothetical protein
MAKVALNGLDVISGTQRCNRITVPEIVKSCVRPANGYYNFFEIPYHSLGNQISTQLICKNQIRRIGPSGSCFLLMLILLEFPISQQLHNPRGGHNSARLIVLQRNQAELAARFLFLLELLAD